MNRRSFLTAMLQAGAACAVLPPALTYARTWKRVESGLLTPVFDPATYMGEWQLIHVTNQVSAASLWTGLLRRGTYPAGLSGTMRVVPYTQPNP